MVKLNKRQRGLVERTQVYYNNLKSKKEKDKHVKLLIDNYVKSTDEFFIKSYEAFAEINKIDLPKKI